MWDVPISLNADDDETVALSDISDSPLRRIVGTGPWDPCFSYREYPESNGVTRTETGIVTCGVTLIGGAPGSGKSTLSNQLADVICEITQGETLLVAAEEAKEQVKDRCLRLNLKHRSPTGGRSKSLIRVYPMGASSDLGEIFTRRKPKAVVIDSLPGLTKDPELAVEYCKRFKEYAVGLDCPFLVIDHITKDHDLAGLMALQHEVDTILLFTKLDNKRQTRHLSSAMKNRFGAAREVYLDMTNEGLVKSNYREGSGDDDDDNDWTGDDET